MQSLISFFYTHRFAVFTVLGIVAITLLPDLVSAQLFDTSRDSIDAVANAGGEQSFRQLLLNVINFVLGFVGIIAVIFLIYGGFQYMTSAGEETEKATQTILYAIVGIIVIIFSYAIVNTITEIATGTDQV